MMLILVVLSFAIAASAFLFDSPQAIWHGYKRILSSPSPLLTDYLELGGVGAAFFNAGIMALVSVVIVAISGTKPSGAILAAVFTLAGFSFFGKNLFNSLPITSGVFLYGKLFRVQFRKLVLIGLFGTTLGPLVSLLMFGIGLPLWLGIGLGILVGLLVGLIMPPLVKSFMRFHHGYSLYNVGFTGGMIGLIAIGFLGYLGVPLEGRQLLFAGNHAPFAWWLGLFFFLLAVFGILTHRRLTAIPAAADIPPEARRPQSIWSRYGLLLMNAGCMGDDYAALYGVGVTFLNMGVTGLLALFYVLLMGGTLTGPVIGGLFTVCGFAAFGKHPHNILPIVAGVFLMNVITGVDNGAVGPILAALFGTTLAPIAGHYGIVAGLIAGMTHMAVVANVGMLHAGVNLYNNGFSGGFVAAFYIPILQLLDSRGLIWRPLITMRSDVACELKLDSADDD